MDAPHKFIIWILHIILQSHIICTVTPSLREQFYMTFKEANKENWQEILEINSMLELFESTPMVSQCTQMFNKICRQTTSLVSPDLLM